MATESESVVESHTHITPTGMVQCKIHSVIYLRILMYKIDGRRNYRFIYRMYAGKSFHSAGSTEQMAVHRLG